MTPKSLLSPVEVLRAFQQTSPHSGVFLASQDTPACIPGRLTPESKDGSGQYSHHSYLWATLAAYKVQLFTAEDGDRRHLHCLISSVCRKNFSSSWNRKEKVGEAATSRQTGHSSSFSSASIFLSSDSNHFSRKLLLSGRDSGCTVSTSFKHPILFLTCSICLSSWFLAYLLSLTILSMKFSNLFFLFRRFSSFWSWSPIPLTNFPFLACNSLILPSTSATFFWIAAFSSSASSSSERSSQVVTSGLSQQLPTHSSSLPSNGHSLAASPLLEAGITSSRLGSPSPERLKRDNCSL